MTRFLLILFCVVSCSKTPNNDVVAIEGKKGLYPILNCTEKTEYVSGYGIDTVGISYYCHRHYQYPSKNVYLWECEYLSKLDEIDKGLKRGCWYYYIDGHQFNIHHHN